MADICLTCIVGAAADLSLVAGSVFPHVTRWFLTVSAQPAISSVVGSAASVAETVGVPGVVTSANGEKWNRCRIRVKELVQEGLKAVGKRITMKVRRAL